MAEEKKDTTNVGKAQVFTKGMHSDNDPRYQPEGTYRDAENVRLVSRDGDTYTLENIDGTRKTLKLDCTNAVHTFTANILGETGLTVGTSYKWKFTYVNFTNFALSGTGFESTVTLGPYVYTDQSSLMISIAADINDITDGAYGQVFNAYTNPTQVVVESRTIGSEWSQIVAISNTTQSPAYGSALMHGYSHQASGAGSYSHETHTSLIRNPLQLEERYGRLCDLTIVGHYSFLTDLYLFTYDINSAVDDGQIWKIEFYNDGTFKSKSIEYNNALSFNKDRKLIVEGIVENDCITRLYWTDDRNPIRSLNLTDPNSFAFTLNDLVMSPKTDMDRPVLKNVGTGGSLECGMYQVGYKLISQGGSNSSISPLSNLIAISSGSIDDFNNVSSGDPTSGKSSAGIITSKSFTVEVNDIDTDFADIEFYILVYEVYNAGPTKILKSNTFNISTSSFEYTHNSNALTPILLEDFLVGSNTFDTCKDIAVKDQRLFAANLRTVSKDISGFDTEVYRWKASDVHDILDTTGFDGPCDFLSETGMNNGAGAQVAWTNSALGAGNTTYTNGRKTSDPNVWDENETDYKYLPIACANSALKRMSSGSTGPGYRSCLLGAQTRYFDSTNGGIRITFQTEDRIVDTEQKYSYWRSDGEGNRPIHGVPGNGTSTYIIQVTHSGGGIHRQLVNKDETDTLGTTTQDNHSQNVDTFYQNIDYDSNDNPYISYDSRGYQRGETYRFAIAFFDKNNRIIQTKYVGDIKMPEHWENQYRFKDNKDTSIEYDGSQGVGFSGMELYDDNNFILDQNIYCEDFRVSYIKGIRNPYNDYIESDVTTGLPQDRHYSGGGYNEQNNIGGTATRPDLFPYANVQAAEKFSSVGVQGHITNEITMAAASSDGYFYPDKVGGVDRGDRTFGDVDFNHYVQDLHLRFEVIIPDSLKDIIGGYKVVRVKREEKDKTILAQGLLTQCGLNHEAHAGNPAFTSSIIGVGLDQDQKWGVFGSGGQDFVHEDLVNSWASNLHDKYSPICNPAFFMDNPVPSIGSPSHPQPCLSNGNNHSIPNEYVSNIKQGQFNDYSQSKTFGLNKYFTFDSPDTVNMSAGWQHKAGLKLDVVSVMKNVDYAKFLQYNAQGGTGIGSGWHMTDKGEHGQPGTSGGHYSIYQGRVWMKSSDFHHGGAGRMDTSTPETYYTKFVTYDTRAFKFPSSLINLTNNVASPVVPYQKNSIDHYWQNLQSIEFSGLIGWGEKSTLGGVNFSNYATCFHMWSGENNTTHVHSGNSWTAAMCTFVHPDYIDNSGVGLNPNRTLSGMNRKASVGKCAESVFIALDDSSADTILSVPDIDTYYMRNSDSPRTGDTWASTNSNFSAIYSGDAYTQIGTLNQHILNSRIPYALMGNIKKTVANQYGGLSSSNLKYNLFIDTGHYTYVGDSISGTQTSKVAGGDVYVEFYGLEKYTGGKIDKDIIETNDTELDQNRGGNTLEWFFPVETYVNTGNLDGTKKLREYLYQNFPISDPHDVFNLWISHGGEDHDYNEVYSQEPDAKSYLITDDDECEILHMPHQIAYSNIKVSGEPSKDAWKNFGVYDFHDVDGVFGSINNLFVLNDYMYFLQNIAVGVLDINPRTMITTNDGSQIHAGKGDTVQDHRYITTKFGCQHQHSLITGNNFSYWVDALHEKIFQFDGKKVDPITDTKGHSAFLKNILNTNSGVPVGTTEVNLIKSTDTPLLFLGIHGGYGKSNGDVIFTFFDTDGKSTSYTKDTIVYNDKIEAFVSKLSTYPNLWIEHMNRLYTTENHYVNGFTEVNQASSNQDELHEWESNTLDPSLNTNPWKTVFYNPTNSTTPTNTQYVHGFNIESVINELPHISKIFDNMGVVMTMDNWELVNTADNNLSKLGSEMVGLTATEGYSTTFDEIVMSTELSDFANIGTHTIFNSVSPTLMDNRVIYREGVLHFPTRAEFVSTEGISSSLGRLRGTYMKIKFKSNDTTNKFNIFALRPKYRKSHR